MLRVLERKGEGVTCKGRSRVGTAASHADSRRIDWAEVMGERERGREREREGGREGGRDKRT